MTEEEKALVTEISQLSYSKTGAVEPSLKNIFWILEHDPSLAGIKYDLMRGAAIIAGKVPYERGEGSSEWIDAGDLAHIHKYFASEYEIDVEGRIDEALAGLKYSTKAFHPVKEYLEATEWDGKSRVDKLLINLLGAEDNVYSREAIRKALVAAVTRVYKPGTKFDNMLVLVGPQGIGKSTLFDFLGMQWYSDSLTMGDMKDKSGAEKVLGKFIVEVPELSGMRKAEAETIKSFITRREDQYRPAYGRVVEMHPRTCILVGTTNAVEGFLRDTTGNRRFWPVEVHEGGKVFKLTPEDIAQIWAEAKALYEAGESLLLSPEAEALAIRAQQVSMEGSVNEEEIAAFLEHEVPTDWRGWSKPERLGFWYKSGLVSHMTPVYKDVQRSLEPCCTPIATFTREVPGLSKRERVCMKELWVECLGRPEDRLGRQESLELARTLKKLGWKLEEKATKLKAWGVVKMYKKR